MNLTNEQKATVLRSYGFTIGARNAEYKTAFPGSFMVRENAKDTSDDWCVVGDDMDELIDLAFSMAHYFSNFDAVCADVAAGGAGVLRGDDIHAIITKAEG